MGVLICGLMTKLLLHKVGVTDLMLAVPLKSKAAVLLKSKAAVQLK